MGTSRRGIKTFNKPKQMNIYIIEKGEEFEGGRVISAHTTRQGAEMAVLARIKKQNEEFGDEWVEARKGRWQFSCNYVQIVELEVQD